MTCADLLALCERATKGVSSHDHGDCALCDALEDDVAAARTWLPALIEVAEAARTVGTFDDFGDPEALCPECSPTDPRAFINARMTLCDALARLDEAGR